MRSLRCSLALACVALIATNARAESSFSIGSLDGASRGAALWIEMTRGPTFTPAEPVPNVTPRVFEAAPRLGARSATRGLYLWGDDAFHLVPRRVGVWGWGLVAGGHF